MLALVADDLVHEPASGPLRTGKAAFTRFLQHIHDCYYESADDLQIAGAGDGSVTAAFLLRRLDLATYADRLIGMPVMLHFKAHYHFDVRGGRIVRIAMHRDLLAVAPSSSAASRMAARWLDFFTG